MQKSQHRRSNFWWPPQGLHCWIEIHIVYFNRLYNQLAINNLKYPKLNPEFLVGSVLLIVLFLCTVILCVSTVWVPFGVRYDFRIKPMFGLSLPPVVCRRAHVLFTLFVFACPEWCPTHIVWCFCLFFWIVYFWLPLRYSPTFNMYIVTFTGIKISIMLWVIAWS